ncbi:hypothetical protein EYC84_004929 [Monilinia fructicola]|uniref:Phosphoglycerate mutase-like protein n=1 Tax=Monilinia fructicola TaxID=38448 RepID=A0A5M9K4J5_MONFR|nr:hypothetical protein EYC84_004929 [Monilinia fructicola]
MLLPDQNLPPVAPSTIDPNTQPEQTKELREDDSIPTSLPNLIHDNPSTDKPLIEILEIKDPSPISQPAHPVVFHFMRHGEAYNNIKTGPNRYKVKDPGLTPNGKLQCERARRIFPLESNIRVILCSPMTRAIETTLITFQDVLESGKVRATADSSFRERGKGESSTGSPLAEIKEKYGEYIDFDALVLPGWEVNTEKSAAARARKVKRQLFNFAKSVQEKIRDGEIVTSKDVPYEIAIVSHAAFLKTMLVKELGGCRKTKKKFHGFYNAEIKSFSFDTIDGPAGVEYSFTQTAESKKRKPALRVVAL